MKTKFTFQTTKLDADDQFFFERELEFIKSRTYDVKQPALKYREILPVSHEAGEGAESITYRQYDARGVAKIVANYAKDFPRADVVGQEFTSPVKSLGSSYGYNVQEIRSARFANKPLEQRRANSARRAIMEQENQIALFGNSLAGLKGFLNNAAIGEYTVPADGTGNVKPWSAKTPDLIIRDLNGLVNSVVEVTKGVELPDTILLPLTAYNYINTTPRASTSDMSIRKWFLENNEYVKRIMWLNELQTAGDLGTRRMMAYRMDPEALSLEIPKEFEQFPPQEQGMDFVVHCHSRIGGVIVYYPLSVAFGDGF